MRSVLFSRKPTTSAGIGSPLCGYISQRVPTAASGQYPSITSPTTWVTYPWNLIGLIVSTTGTYRLRSILLIAILFHSTLFGQIEFCFRGQTDRLVADVSTFLHQPFEYRRQLGFHPGIHQAGLCI